jgi:hypothetical protein
MRFTLIAEGGSDKALIPIIKWVLRQSGVRTEVTGDWVDWGRFRRPPQNLVAEIERAVQLFPCDILFVHRDADNPKSAERRGQIRQALDSARRPVPPAVCVVPVHETEAWFLFSERAIREASGNPTGRERIELPRMSEVELLPDPKATLHGLLRDGSGLTGRRLKGFRTGPAIHRMAEIIEDFSPLSALSAFEEFRDEVGMVAASLGG